MTDTRHFVPRILPRGAKHSPETKISALRRLAPLGSESFKVVSKTTGVSEVTLRQWVHRYEIRDDVLWKRNSNVQGIRHSAIASPGSASCHQVLDGAARLAAVIETHGMNEYERFAYCVEHRITPREIDAWRAAYIALDVEVATTPAPQSHDDAPTAQTQEARQPEYLTTDQLAERIHYDARTIRTRMMDRDFIEGVHYIRPFGHRKILFLWEPIERDMARRSPKSNAPKIVLEESQEVVSFAANSKRDETFAKPN